MNFQLCSNGKYVCTQASGVSVTIILIRSVVKLIQSVAQFFTNLLYGDIAGDDLICHIQVCLQKKMVRKTLEGGK